MLYGSAAEVHPQALNLANAKSRVVRAGGKVIDVSSGEFRRLPWIGDLIGMNTMIEYIHDMTCMFMEENNWVPFAMGAPLMNPFVIVADAKCAQLLFQKKTFHQFEKGAYFNYLFKPLLGRGIFNVDGIEAHKQRKAASNVFSKRFTRDAMHPVFKANAVMLVNHIDTCIADSRGDGQEYTRDMANTFYKFTLDSFVEVAFGVKLGCTTTKGRVAFADAFDRVQSAISRRVTNPFWWVDKLLGRGLQGTINADCKTVNDLVLKVVRERRQTVDVRLGVESLDSKYKSKTADLISYFLADAARNKTTLSDVYLRDLVANFIIAGRDTTAVTLSWMFYELEKNPRVLTKIRAELDKVLGPATGEDADAKFDISRIPSFESVQNLKYLHAVVSETLRLHPAVPMELVSSTENVTLPVPDNAPAGTKPVHVKAGSFIGLSIYSMGRNPAIWGPDCNVFKPERFVEKPNPSQYEFVSFKAGPRICLGKRVAYLEAKTVAAVLLRRYDFAFQGNIDDVTYQMSLTLAPRDPMMYTVKRRAKAEEEIKA